MRLMPQHSGGVSQRAALLTGALAVALNRDGDLVDHAGNFGGGFPQRLAGFFTDAVAQSLGMALQGGGKLFEHGNTLIQRACRPGWECCTSSLHGGVHLLRRGGAAMPDGFLADRVE